jgi:hypothetical protein
MHALTLQENFQTEPKEEVTDEALLRYGVVAQGRIRGNYGQAVDYQKLYPGLSHPTRLSGFTHII